MAEGEEEGWERLSAVCLGLSRSLECAGHILQHEGQECSHHFNASPPKHILVVCRCNRLETIESKQHRLTLRAGTVAPPTPMMFAFPGGVPMWDLGGCWFSVSFGTANPPRCFGTRATAKVSWCQQHQVPHGDGMFFSRTSFNAVTRVRRVSARQRGKGMRERQD